MLNALNAYVENPAIVFNYTYLPDEIPEKVVERPMKTQKDAPEPKKSPQGQKRSAPSSCRCCSASRWPLRWPVWPCAGAILNDSSTLMSEKADVVLADYSGMTQDEVNAQPQVSSGPDHRELGAVLQQRLRCRLRLQAVAGGGPHRP